MEVALRFSQPSGKIAIRIAAFLSAPLEFLDERVAMSLLSDVQGHDLTPLLQVRFARSALNSYLADLTGIAKIHVDDPTAQALRQDEKSVEALTLALGDLAILEQIKPRLVAAICQKEINGALMKTDREAIAALLGERLRGFASREAPVFYPNLGRLASAAGTVLRRADDTPFDSHPVRDFAASVVLAYLKGQSPLAAQIYSLRCRGRDDSAADEVQLDPQQVDEIRRLISQGGSA